MSRARTLLGLVAASAAVLALAACSSGAPEASAGHPPRVTSTDS